ncbi:hypothetical protein MKX01_022161 [Papaver californicum]|nr:hypothetical protein MKX01_022161 [Papaver californicum]
MLFSISIGLSCRRFLRLNLHISNKFLSHNDVNILTYESHIISTCSYIRQFVKHTCNLLRCCGSLPGMVANSCLLLETMFLDLKSARIPSVRELVKSLTGKDPNIIVNPGEVVALGAAAGALSGGN